MPSYTWNRTREQVRDMVLRKLGVIGANDIPEAEDAALVDEAMDARLKELQTLNVLWWLVAPAQTSLSLTAGATDVAIAADDFLLPVTASLVVNGEQRPVEIIGHREYQEIPKKDERGQPSRVFISGSVARFWPAPESNFEARITYQAIAKDSETGQPLDMPAAAVRAFADLVAGDLVDDFGVEPNKGARLMAKQPAAIRTLKQVAAQPVAAVAVAPDWF